MNARDVMPTRVVRIGPGTPTTKIAELLLCKGISAVPVVDGTGAPIGMVGEGDLIGREKAAPEAGATGPRIFDWLDKQFLHAHRSEGGQPTPHAVAAASKEALSVDDFRGLAADFERREAHHYDEARRAAAQQHRQKRKISST